MSVVALRPVEDSDLDLLFDQRRDPESVRMAAFTAESPNDRSAFDAHLARVRDSPGITRRQHRQFQARTGYSGSRPRGGGSTPARRSAWATKLPLALV